MKATTSKDWDHAGAAGHRPARARIPRARQSAAPDHRPRAGHDLVTGIDVVLAAMSGPPSAAPSAAGPASGSVPVHVGPMADDLKGALARTAACGDTCQVRTAVDAVRLAIDLLLAGAVEQAQAVLIQVKAELSAPNSAGDELSTVAPVRQHVGNVR